jgi:cytochrome c-type protein NapC
MEQMVFQEYKQSVHYKNASGVRATCFDCHVPKAWLPKMIRKIKVSNELYYKALGSINTQKNSKQNAWNWLNMCGIA